MLAHLSVLICTTFGLENNILFERVECNVNSKYISEYKCEMRPVAPNVFKINGTFALTEPINNLWVHFQTFYRYSHYQKFADVWEDGCGFLRNMNEARVLKAIFDSINSHNLQINFELQCPFKGVLKAYHPHANISHFWAPLLPAGRYRIDANATKGKNGVQIVFGQIYFTISDLRIWH